MLECLAEVAEECDELEAAQQELAVACTAHGAQGSALREVLKEAQATLDLVQERVAQGSAMIPDEELERRSMEAREDIKKAVETMLFQIQSLVRLLCCWNWLPCTYTFGVCVQLTGWCRLNPRSTWPSGFMGSPCQSRNCLERTGSTRCAM